MYKSRYTVWIGGTEVNDFLLNKSEADVLANTYKNQGHDDVQIQDIDKVNKMLYQPKHYPTMAALRAAAIYAGNNSTSSNEVINNAEIFGYVNNRPYEAVIAFCELSETHYWVAGEVIPAHWL